jgi:hypothetical protein
MIAPGTRLGPYVIAAPIGAGGMGEVYEVIDSRRDRFAVNSRSTAEAECRSSSPF